MALEASQEIDYIISQAGDEVDFETTATRIADIIGGLAELGVPMINTMSQLYQAQNDVRGVTTMKRAQNILYEQGWADTEKTYQDMDRNLYEKIANVLWGGFDKAEID
jgi:glutathione synthase/RimK-type ligase-like ATP-grasp enzyme